MRCVPGAVCEWFWASVPNARVAVQSGDNVLALHGQFEARPGHTNMVKVLIAP